MCLVVADFVTEKRGSNSQGPKTPVIPQPRDRYLPPVPVPVPVTVTGNELDHSIGATDARDSDVVLSTPHNHMRRVLLAIVLATATADEPYGTLEKRVDALEKLLQHASSRIAHLEAAKGQSIERQTEGVGGRELYF